jgi:hypothetical protein
VLLLSWLCSKSYVWSFDVPTKTAIITSIKKRAEMGKFGKLVNPDVSEGLERVGRAAASQQLLGAGMHVCGSIHTAVFKHDGLQPARNFHGSRCGQQHVICVCCDVPYFGVDALHQSP